YMQKLEWMNGMYLRAMPEQLLAEQFARWLERTLPYQVPRPLDRAYVEAITPLVRERVKLLKDVNDLVDFFFTSEVTTPGAETLLGKPYRGRAEAAARSLEGS